MKTATKQKEETTCIAQDLSTKRLRSVMPFLKSASPAKTALPILTAVIAEPCLTGLLFRTCDGESWASALIPCKPSGGKPVAFHLRRSGPLLAYLGEKINLESEGSVVRLSSGGRKFSLLKYPADECPPVPLMDREGKRASASSSDMRDALDFVLPAIGTEDFRPILAGVSFCAGKTGMLAVATNTHILAWHKVPDNIPACVVGVRQLTKFLDLAEEAFEMEVGSSKARFASSDGNIRLTTQLLQGTFPNWERVVPSEFTRSADLPRLEFIDALLAAGLYAKDNVGRVRMRFQGSLLTISARSEDVGEAEAEVPLVGKNLQDFEIAFNYRYLLTVARAYGTEGLRIEMTEPSRPAVFTGSPVNNESGYVIMPMAIG